MDEEWSKVQDEERRKSETGKFAINDEEALVVDDHSQMNLKGGKCEESKQAEFLEPEPECETKVDGIE